MRTALIASGLCGFAALGGGALAQTAPDPEVAAEERPIIVEGSAAEIEQERVQTGSRIRGEPRFTDLRVASSTGVSGLTPGAGMDPLAAGNVVRRRETSQCVSDNEAISERAACLFLQANQALEGGDNALAADIYRYLVSSGEFAAPERLAAGTQLYNLPDTREEALIRLLATESLPEERRPSARRSLADMALERGDKALAIERLEAHVAQSPDDAASLANLAILRRETGVPGAGDAMRQAIAAMQAKGEDVPEGWQDFANAPKEEQAMFATTTVLLETTIGTITIALETERAPITAGNFLRYVEEGRFDGTVFYRAMSVDWGDQPNGLIQGGTQWDPDRVLPGIPHEPTTTTGLSHTRGALSMAMGDPGTANGDFSIMVGDQTGLDAKPESDDPVWRNGYAVFGYVTDGMEVVEAIHAAAKDPTKGEGWMRGQMLDEPVVITDARRVEAEQAP